MSTPPPQFDGKQFVRGLSTAPGVYRMFAADDSVLYVGKAGALKKRVASYFSNAPKNTRTMAMLAQVARMDVTVRSEEHTSDLQSLMRISYAVFCLNKKQ